MIESESILRVRKWINANKKDFQYDEKRHMKRLCRVNDTIVRSWKKNWGKRMIDTVDYYLNYLFLCFNCCKWKRNDYVHFYRLSSFGECREFLLVQKHFNESDTRETAVFRLWLQRKSRKKRRKKNLTIDTNAFCSIYIARERERERRTDRWIDKHQRLAGNLNNSCVMQ